MEQDLYRQGTLIRVLIDLRVRVLQDGLAALLSNWRDIQVVEGASTSAEGLDLKCGIDAVLLDTGKGTSQLSQRIQHAADCYGSAKIIVIGVSDQAGEIIECIEAGASAYASIDTGPEDLIDIIRSVYLGQVVCPPEISAMLFERLASLKRQLGSGLEDKLTALTPRELEILQLISNGLSNKEIARVIRLELQTVKNYVHSILEKLRVQNRREAARYARSCAGFTSGTIVPAESTLTHSV